VGPWQPQVHQKYRHPDQEGKNYTEIKEAIQKALTPQQEITSRKNKPI
jgi:hypothetical protein